MEEKSISRKIVVPGETLMKGEDYLPGEGVRREGEEIVASRFGFLDISDRFVKIIPLSGVYIPRRGNVVIGQVIDIIGKGWILSLGGHQDGFLSVAEVPRYVEQNEMQECFDFGDVIAAKIWGMKGRSLDLSVKMRGFGKLEEGIIININPNKVPRVIGKEGSMVKIIKEATNCNITIGQNGVVWIKGDTIEDELKTKKIIQFVCENAVINGLTEKVQEFVKDIDKKKIKKEK